MPRIIHQYYRRRRALLNAGEVSIPQTPKIKHEPKRVVYEEDEHEDEEHITENLEDNAEDDETQDFSPEQDCGDAGCCESSKSSMSETKCRKAMLKLGMKPVSGVHRVTIRKNENNFHITEPEVFKSPTAESYVVFGAAKLQNTSPILLQHVQHGLGECPKHGSSTMAHEEDEDETGLDPKDIELMMSQTGVSRAKAMQGTQGCRQ